MTAVDEVSTRLLRGAGQVVALTGRRIWVWAGLMAALAGALDFVPLFNLLGYDFCFAIGLLAAFAAVDIGHGVVAAARRARRPTGVLTLVKVALAAAVGITLLPLTLSLANILRVRNCNLLAGLEFFLLLPVATAVYGATVGVLATVVAPRRGGRAVAFAFPIASILWTLWRLYVDPAVFAFDPFGGYFPGPIYDEALRPSATLVSFRLVNLVWLAAAVTMTFAIAPARQSEASQASQSSQSSQAEFAPRGSWRWREWHRPSGVFGLLLAVVAVALWMQRGPLGFHVRQVDLLRLLDGERHSSRVILRYASTAGLKPADVDLEMQDVEFRYDQLRDTFGVEPDGPITVFQFASAEEKKVWVGAGATLYAKPWLRQIFLQADGFPARRLRHEMAHVFAGAFGDPVFGVSFAVRWRGPVPVPHLASGLIEGIAEAADFTDPDGGSTTHQEAAAILADGRAPPLAQLMGAGFSAVSGPRAYTLAGSFVRYLLETRGADRLREIYASAGDFERVYGVGLEGLESEWRQFLSQQPLSAEQRARAREQFRRPAIFNKVCAREQAARVSEARGLMVGAPARAAALLEQSCADDPGEPTLRIELAQAIAASGEPSRALSLLADLARNADVTAPVRSRAANLAATLHFQSGDFDNARASVREVLAASTDETERRQASARLRALDGERARRTLGRALFGDDPSSGLDPVLLFFLLTEFSRLHPGEALGPYFIGRQLALRDPQLALTPLRAACDPAVSETATATATGTLPLPADFQRECLRLFIWASFKTGDLARSRLGAERLRASSTEEAERLRMGDFLARVAWQQAKR